MKESFKQATKSSLLMGLFLICSTVRADIIAVHTSFAEGYNAAASTFEVRFGVGFGGGTNGPIFDTLTLSAADSGKTFVFTQAEDPDYFSLVSALCNGRSDWISYELSFDHFQSIALGAAAPESTFFSPLPAGSNGVDFQGFRLDSINLRIDSVQIGPTDFSIQTFILVDPINAVPEPGSGLALLAGIGGLAIWQRGHAKRQSDTV